MEYLELLFNGQVKRTPGEHGSQEGKNCPAGDCDKKKILHDGKHIEIEAMMVVKG